MKIIYENEMGRLLFRGGGDRVFNITAIDGLSLPETEADTVRYPDVPGQTVNRISLLPRTITMAGDICDKDGKELAFAAKILSGPGTLFVVTKRSTKKIPCRASSFLPQKRRGIFVPFTLQLICDDPCFCDVSDTKTTVYQRTKLLKSKIFLPQMFSKRTTEGTLYNRGATVCSPIIYISAPNGAICEKGIEILNVTTGANLLLSCSIKAGETVTVDCDNRKVFGSQQGNLLNALNKNTQLSNFVLTNGKNIIRVEAEDETEPLNVEIVHTNRYLEAML